MAGEFGETRCGLCIVRVETDASAQLLITVTARRDVDDSARESVLRTASIDAALARVAEFLAAAGQSDGSPPAVTRR